MYFSAHPLIVLATTLLASTVLAVPNPSSGQERSINEAQKQLLKRTSAIGSISANEKRDNMYRYPNTDPDSGGRGRPPALDLSGLGYSSFYDGESAKARKPRGEQQSPAIPDFDSHNVKKKDKRTPGPSPGINEDQDFDENPPSSTVYNGETKPEDLDEWEWLELEQQWGQESWVDSQKKGGGGLRREKRAAGAGAGASGGVVKMSCQSCVAFCHTTETWDLASTQSDCINCGEGCAEMYSAYGSGSQG